MATKESLVTEWKITKGPGKFDFAVAYFRQEKVTLFLVPEKKSGFKGYVSAQFEQITPRVGSRGKNWVVWGRFTERDSDNFPCYFHGDYSFDGPNKGLIQEVTQEQYSRMDRRGPNF